VVDAVRATNNARAIMRRFIAETPCE